PGIFRSIDKPTVTLLYNTWIGIITFNDGIGNNFPFLYCIVRLVTGSKKSANNNDRDDFSNGHDHVSIYETIYQNPCWRSANFSLLNLYKRKHPFLGILPVLAL